MTKIELNGELAKRMAEMAEIGALLGSRGWAERNAGNLSYDVTEWAEGAGLPSQGIRSVPHAVLHPSLAGRYMFITATGSRLGELAARTAENLLLIRIAPNLDHYDILWGGEGPAPRATSEFPSHLVVHEFIGEKNRPHRAVLHSHPTELIALTHLPRGADENALNDLLWRMHPEVRVVLPDGIGFVPYRCPGTDALAEASLEALSGRRICMWEKHGCLALGRNMREAYDLADTANKAARIYFLCRSAGFDPSGLRDEDLEELDRTYGGGS